MSFVPGFTNLLLAHLKKDERQRILKSIIVSAAPELWLSLESAALLDINREHFGLGGQLDERSNVPRWLIAAERRKVDIWVENKYDDKASTAIEFKVVHNNKNAYYKIWEIRKDLVKQIPRTSPGERIERWGIVLLSYSRFYSDQQGNYSYGKFDSCQGFLDAFENGLNDNDEWYAGAPELELVIKPTRIADLDDAHYIEPGKGSAVYLALVRCKA